jgi:hypothetical protein
VAAQVAASRRRIGKFVGGLKGHAAQSSHVISLIT